MFYTYQVNYYYIVRSPNRHVALASTFPLLPISLILYITDISRYINIVARPLHTNSQEADPSV